MKGGNWVMQYDPGKDMDNQIIRQLYHNALRMEANTDKISRKTKSDIEALLKEIGEDDGSENYEKHRDEMFLAAAAAEENGFVNGFIYAFRLFTECAVK